jgi:hypothetical protein
MLEKVSHAREYRFVHLDVVSGNLEVCNRVSSEVRTEEKCISPITPSELFAASSDQDIGTIATVLSCPAEPLRMTCVPPYATSASAVGDDL